jgi:hypothetical protein
MTTREESYQRLQDLRSNYEGRAASLGELNEAATRLLLVDELLLLLGWDKADFHPETKVGVKSFTDYSLSAGAATRIIVEAKRTGHTFSSTKSVLRKSEYELGYMLTAFGPALSEVINQARRYCESTRVPYAAITNGAEWIIAQLIPPPGRSLNDLRCFYIGNILGQDSHFETLWAVLAKDSVLQGGLEEAFDELNSLEYEFCRDPRSVLGDWTSQSLQAPSPPYMRDFYDRFFDEITDPQRRTMLDYCYVSNAKLDQYESAIKRTLEDTAPKYLEDAEELQPGETQKVLGTPSGDRKGRVILIVGSVGAGKTTFVTKAIISHRATAFRFTLLDLIDENDVSFISLWSRLSRELRDKNPAWTEHEFLRRIFHKQLEAVRRGPDAKLFEKEPDRLIEAEAAVLRGGIADPETYITALFLGLGRQGNANVVFLDNVDRLSEQSQREIYSFAHKLSATTGAAVILPIRETTYYRAKEEGFLDVRSSDIVFHLQAPDLVQVVSRRVRYIEFQLNDPPGPDRDARLKAWKTAEDWSEFRRLSLQYANDLKQSLLQGTHGKTAMMLLASIAWHNVRRFFRSLRHVHAIAPSGGEAWSPDTLVSGLMVAEDGAATPFLTPALFQSPSLRHLAHFLRLRLLVFLQFGVTQWEAKAGLSHNRILSFLRSYGYRKSWIDAAITGLVRERLLECLEIPVGQEFARNYSLSDAHSFRCSPLAVLLIKDLQFERPYLAAAGWGMSFLDESFFGEFVAEGSAIKDLVSDSNEPASQLFSGSKLPLIVVSYLHAMLEDERIINEMLVGSPEVAAVEREMALIRHRWETIVPDLAEPLDTPADPVVASPSQMPLPLTDAGVAATQVDFKPIPRPSNLDRARIAHASHMGALILWALVAARTNRMKVLSGAELTDIINKYAVSDHRAVLGTNVSRALRSQLLLSQSWLRNMEGGASRKPRYALAGGWEQAWKDTFDEDPPSL